MTVPAIARTSLAYRPELDGIRALAILAVIAQHINLLNDCRVNPLDQVRILWCARLASHRGDVAGANALLDLANISFPASYVGGAETRVSDSGMIGRQLIGDPADLWATYTYRRPAPWDILVPSLLHLTLK